MVNAMGRKRTLLFGVGVNDADYLIDSVTSGRCHYYSIWSHMLKRCYSEKFKLSKPSYNGCSVCEEWLTFSNFKRWMEKQDWQGRQLDKDILVVGNKTYSPETCVFVSQLTNSFTQDCAALRGDFPIGVDLDKRRMLFRSRCSNPFTKNYEWLGYFSCQNKAHQAWRKRKHELALQLADLQTDERVAQALRTRYL